MVLLPLLLHNRYLLFLMHGYWKVQIRNYITRFVVNLNYTLHACLFWRLTKLFIARITSDFDVLLRLRSAFIVGFAHKARAASKNYRSCLNVNFKRLLAVFYNFLEVSFSLNSKYISLTELKWLKDTMTW